MNKAEIIILAGGLGKRMKSELPKVLNTLNGIALIDYVLDAVEAGGVCDKPIVVVGKARELVINHVGNRARFVVQEEQKGTGHAVLCAKEEAQKSGLPVIVLSGDMPFVTSDTIKNILNEHINSKSLFTMATSIVSDYSGEESAFYDFGRIVRDADNNIVKIVEKKDATEEELLIKEINPSYFCVDSSWLFGHLPKLSKNNAQGEYYLTDIVQMATSESIKINSVLISAKEAIGINTIQHLEMLNGRL